MALEVRFSQSHEIALGRVPNPYSFRRQLTFDDLDRALSDQGSDEAGGSW